MSGSDDPEEIRKRIEAQLAGQNLGFIIGIVLALLKEDKQEKAEQQERFDEQEQREKQDEEQTDEMQMI
jgi:predicted histidine transporter YuiF (NhaC family)